MLRVALIGVLICGCAAPVAVGASTMTAAALGASAMQRKAGGCYAMCVQGTVCNPNSGLCERMPCDGACRSDQHCETTFNKSECVAGAPSDAVSKAPGTQRLSEKVVSQCSSRPQRPSHGIRSQRPVCGLQAVPLVQTA